MTSLRQETWDTEFFGFPVASLRPASIADLHNGAAAADASGVACTYCSIPSDEPALLAAAQDCGFRVVDVRVELGASDVQVPRGALAPAVRTATANDREWVAALAAHRFVHSRFAADQRFPADAASRLFARWAERGFEGGRREVLVLDDRAGFVICAQDADGWIELIATADGAPRGSGSALVCAAKQWFAARGLTNLAVVTQASNLGALRLYERHGYRIRATSYWLHRWASETSP